MGTPVHCTGGGTLVVTARCGERDGERPARHLPVQHDSSSPISMCSIIIREVARGISVDRSGLS
jgi:hypothetical protein